MRLKKIYKYIISIIFFIPLVILSYNIYKLNFLPMNYYIILNVILLSISTLANICLFVRKKWTKVITIIVYIFLTVISIIGIKYVGDTNSFLNKNFENAKNTYDLSYYIISKNSYSIEDLTDKEIYYYEKTNKIEDVIKKVNNDVKASFIAIDSVERLIKSDIFLIDSASFEIQCELGTMKKNDYKVIYEVTMTFEEEIDSEEDIEGEKGNEGNSENKKEKDPDVLNIYIGGYDFSGVRMDFNALVTLNMRTHKMVVTSIPRDFYLTIPGKGVKDTLSTMSPYGVNNNVRAVEGLLGVKVDYYLVVETTSLVKLVDTIGGITYCSDKAYTTDHALVIGTYDDSKGEHLDIIKGCQHLNGIETLTVARERMAYETQDVARIKNDAKIMNAILDKMKSPSIATKYTSVLNAVGGMYTTTMPKTVVQDGVKSILTSSWSIKNVYLSGKTTWGTVELSGGYKYVMHPSQSSVNSAKQAIREI